MQVGQEHFVDGVERNRELVEADRGAAPSVKQQGFNARLNQNAWAKVIRQWLHIARAEYGDLERGSIRLRLVSDSVRNDCVGGQNAQQQSRA